MSHGWVTSLRGEKCVFTGSVRRDDEWVHRDECFALALAAGAAGVLDLDVTASTGARPTGPRVIRPR